MYHFVLFTLYVLMNGWYHKYRKTYVLKKWFGVVSVQCAKKVTLLKNNKSEM